VRGLFSPRQIQDLLGITQIEYESYGPALPEGDDWGTRGAVDAFCVLEFEHYLQNQLLKDTDVMSMAHSVEIRIPYLDHRLVEYVLGLSIRARLSGGAHKPLLIRALGDALPREVWDRHKMGFTFPFDLWMRERAGDLEAISLEGKRIQGRAVASIWRAFLAGRVHWSRAWALVVLARFDAARRQRVGV
jgi:asparagine synthase (glutamine-hydrolysing)